MIKKSGDAKAVVVVQLLGLLHFSGAMLVVMMLQRIIIGIYSSSQLYGAL